MTGDARLLTAAVERDLPRASWPAWPGGWPGAVESAVLDSVFSVQARYGGPDTGVRRVVRAYAATSGDARPDDLTRLAGWADRGAELAEVVGNHQQIRGTLKAEVTARAAHALTKAGVVHAADVDGGRPEQARAWRSVTGLGDVTWNYVLLLLGRPAVKADVMIRRFVADALGRADVDAPTARALVTEVAAGMGESPTDLDHAIWSWQRRRR